MKLRRVIIGPESVGEYIFRKYDPMSYYGYCFDDIDRGYYQNDKNIGYNEYQNKYLSKDSKEFYI